jgi:SAM-dependent methyltransferase
MNPELFKEMASVQEKHWWFVGRRQILSSVIDRLGLTRQATILEVGCGTGANLEMLRQKGLLHAMEYDAQARAIANSLSLCKVSAGGLPEPIPHADKSMDLVCLLDVLEHIEDDLGGLRRIARLLKPGGCVLVTVPAYRWLWSAHDTAHHHHRRYTAHLLAQTAELAGLKVHRIGYFNSLLFPLVAAVRLVGKLFTRNSSSDATLPRPWINWILLRIFATERYVVARGGFPFGTSVIAVLGTRA